MPITKQQQDAKHEQIKKRITKILNRIKKLCADDLSTAETFSDELEAVLSNMANKDAFGTEGQDDPRGDFRNGDWNMGRVEGIDK